MGKAGRVIALMLSLVLGQAAHAQPAPTPIEEVLLENTELIQKSSRRTIQPAIDALKKSGLPEAAEVLRRWRDKDLWVREADGRYFLAEEVEDEVFELSHVATGEPLGTAHEDEIDDIKPNAGVRKLISSALVEFQLTDPDPAVRRRSLAAIERDPDETQLAPLRAALEREEDPELAALMRRRERILSVLFAEDVASRVAAIESLADDLSVEARGTLNPLLATKREVADALPSDVNLARTLTPGRDLTHEEAYALLVKAERAEPIILAAERDAALVEHASDGKVAGVEIASLDSREARDAAYAKLAEIGLVRATLTEDERNAIADEFVYFDAYAQPPEITAAALSTVAAIEGMVATNEAADLVLDALSLASIYFLAAIGLAITFGVMGVINMAHGEFIMLGAYTGYVVQQFVPDRTLSLIVALPLAFAITFAAGVLLERLVIRHLYHRPLETLLATFGVSIALQQLAKNVFGTQARPLTAPDWLDGALVINDVLQISYIRIAIFVLAIAFFLLLLFILNRTRLGLEVRAVRQNPRMAEQMGIDRERVNLLTFGLGSGIAGIAGVAIGLFAKVTSDLGASYIVQSFMTVVVGGVGNVFGTLAGATLIGFLQKGIEALNPSNTLAAQTYMVIFIIIFIQFRPRGIVALRGRAAEA